MSHPVFTPRPENDFQEFASCYFERCRREVPFIEALAGKWRFEDLIPGLSDLDTRFIVRDGMRCEDWCEMSRAVGEVHLELCREHPGWARTLEHLPGINLSWSELLDPRFYYPEYLQWNFYFSEDAERLAVVRQSLASRQWSREDEYFQLKKFVTFHGRYNRGIDPAINLGPYESKYPLHSRFMHYFCPAVQAAMSLLERRNIRGKLDSVKLAASRFPEVPAFAELLEAVELHYELPALYEEVELARLEDRLEAALHYLKDAITPCVTLIADPGEKSIGEWRSRLSAIKVSPDLVIFENIKFSRLMRGRLLFYAQAPARFQSDLLILNELRRIRKNFFVIPFATYRRMMGGAAVGDPASFLMDFEGLFPASILKSVRRFSIVTHPNHWKHAQNLKHVAWEISEVFDDFYYALSRIVEDLGFQSDAVVENPRAQAARPSLRQSMA